MGNMNRTIGRVTTMSVVLLAAALPVLAQAPGGPHHGGPPLGPPPFDGPGGPHHGPPDLLGRIVHELDLSQPQRIQIREIVEKYMDGELGTLRQAFGEARHALTLVIWDPAADGDAVLVAARLVSARAEQIAVVEHRMALEVVGVLNEAQREQLRNLLAEGPPAPERMGVGAGAGFFRRGR